MTNTIAQKEERGYEWIDVMDPTEKELQDLGKQYGLLPASINDCLQPEHLPKYERLKNYTFVIIRVYTGDPSAEADTVKELSNKISIFITEQYIITVHRCKWPALQQVNEEYVQPGECPNTTRVLGEIVKAGLKSFDLPAETLTRTLEYYESHIFFKHHKAAILKGLYFLKRKTDVLRRLLLSLYDLIDNIDPPHSRDAYTRDIRDLYVKQHTIFDSLSENTNHLLNIYFNISSQRTNETIRILTIFSVFFMPLTFIVGVYGMNFDVMPEIKWKYGYPVVMAFMAIVVICIYVWFKRKKWL
jgi:magnesium transporter